MKVRLRFEVAIGNAPRHSLHSFSRLLQLKFRALRGHRRIAFEIMKHQFADPVSPLLLRGHGINRELQAIVRIFLRPRLPGLIDDIHSPVRQVVDPIDSSGNFRPRNLQIEPFFRMQNLRRSAAAT